MSRNEGSIALHRLGKTQAEIGRAVGVSGVSVHHWFSGGKKPSESSRQKLLELFAIPLEAWDRAPSKPTLGTPKQATPPSVNEDDAAALGGAFELARELEKDVRALLHELRSDVVVGGIAITPLERSKVMASAATTLDKLRRITGDRDLDRRILKLPTFKRAVDAIVDALKPFPGASIAVAERMDSLHSDSIKGSYNAT